MQTSKNIHSDCAALEMPNSGDDETKQDVFDSFDLFLHHLPTSASSNAGFDQADQTTYGGGDPDADQTRLQSSNPPIDIAKLMDRCEGEIELLAEILGTFCKQGLQCCQSLQKSLDDQNLDQLLFDADFLCGAAGNIFAQDMYLAATRLIRHLAESCSEGPSQPNDRLQLLVRELCSAFLEAKRFWESSSESAQGGQLNRLENVGRSSWHHSNDSCEQELLSADHHLDPTGLSDEHSDAGSVTGDDGNAVTRSQPAPEPDPSKERQDDDEPATRLGGGEPDREAVVERFFKEVRQRFETMKRLRAENKIEACGAEAEETCAMADEVGARGIRDAARALAGAGAARKEVLDALELQLDAAEAIWRSCGLIV